MLKKVKNLNSKKSRIVENVTTTLVNGLDKRLSSAAGMIFAIADVKGRIRIFENEIVNNANENDNDELSKSPEEDNNSAILEEMNKENGGINKEIKDINEVKNIQGEEENNLNKNIPQIEKEELADDNKENNME